MLKTFLDTESSCLRPSRPRCKHAVNICTASRSDYCMGLRHARQRCRAQVCTRTCTLAARARARVSAQSLARKPDGYAKEHKQNNALHCYEYFRAAQLSHTGLRQPAAQTWAARGGAGWTRGGGGACMNSFTCMHRRRCQARSFSVCMHACNLRR